MEDRCLTSLLVFENTINKELVRSLHVYHWKEGRVEKVEREFVFCLKGPYVEMPANALLILRINGQVFRGQVIGLWRCMLAFHAHHHLSSHFNHHIPHLLSLLRNPKLKSVPSLANDLQVITKLSSRGRADGKDRFRCEETFLENSEDDQQQPKKSFPVLVQDLNCLPYSIDTSQLSVNERINPNALGAAMKKKRAASEDIARIALDDLVKCFGLPIVEASRNLKVGVTVLKKKCREFGIPRWPHRKIKSLDGLIRSLQEEAEHQKQENEASAMAIAKRKRMLEREKETIERKPFMEIQSETKRFRQDVFKRRHRARALGLLDI